jgi:hypothetical protein
MKNDKRQDDDLNYIFNINDNAKYNHILLYMRLVDEDTLTIISHEIKKYDYELILIMINIILN